MSCIHIEYHFFRLGDGKIQRGYLIWKKRFAQHFFCSISHMMWKIALLIPYEKTWCGFWKRGLPSILPLVDTRNCMWKMKAVYPKTPKKILSIPYHLLIKLRPLARTLNWLLFSTNTGNKTYFSSIDFFFKESEFIYDKRNKYNDNQRQEDLAGVQQLGIKGYYRRQ